MVACYGTAADRGIADRTSSSLQASTFPATLLQELPPRPRSAAAPVAMLYRMERPPFVMMASMISTSQASCPSIARRFGVVGEEATQATMEVQDGDGFRGFRDQRLMLVDQPVVLTNNGTPAEIARSRLEPAHPVRRNRPGPRHGHCPVRSPILGDRQANRLAHTAIRRKQGDANGLLVGAHGPGDGGWPAPRNAQSLLQRERGGGGARSFAC